MSKEIRRERLVPIFVRDLLKQNSDKEHHCTLDWVKTQLQDRYGLAVEKRTLKRTVNLMLDEDLFIFGSTEQGLWFDRLGYYPE